MKATAIAPSNIAFTKYWGNKDGKSPDLDTPLEYAHKNFFNKVLPIWPTYTKSIIKVL